MLDINQLKKLGFRITKPRQEILSVLASHPVTVQEISDSLQKRNIRIDIASIYRTLELFTDLHIVQAIELGEGKKRYELLDTNNHHHHVVCNGCGVIKDVLLKQENKILSYVTTQSHFKIDNHSLEFFGRCAECQ